MHSYLSRVIFISFFFQLDRSYTHCSNEFVKIQNLFQINKNKFFKIKMELPKPVRKNVDQNIVEFHSKKPKSQVFAVKNK